MNSLNSVRSRQGCLETRSPPHWVGCLIVHGFYAAALKKLSTDILNRCAFFRSGGSGVNR